MSIFIGYCITKKDLDAVRNGIDSVWKIGQRHLSSISEEKKQTRCYCEKTIWLLDDCFENMYSIERCKRQLKPYKDSDNIDLLRTGKIYCDELLIEMKSLLNNIIPLKDLPSCKSLLDCAKDIAMACVKDMANDKFAKIGLGLVSMLSKTNDKVTIENVWHFYNNIIIELEREVHQEGWTFSPVEEALYSKAKAERAYCFKAMLKTEVGFVQELKGIIDDATASKDIREYENTISNSANLVVAKQ